MDSTDQKAFSSGPLIAGDAYFEGLIHAIERLDRILHRAAGRVLATYGPEVAADPFRGLHLSQHEMARLLAGPLAAPMLSASDAPEEPVLLDTIDQDSQLAVLARTYGLSSFDLDLVLLALAPEIDLRYERLYAFLQDDVSRKRPSVDLALNLLCSTAELKLVRREHFASDAPLIRHNVIHLVPDLNVSQPSLLSHIIKLDDGIVRLLLGQGGIDASLRGFCTFLEPLSTFDTQLLPVEVRWALPALVRQARDTGTPLRLYFAGSPSRTNRQVAQALAGEVDAPLLVADLAYAMGADIDFERAMKVLFREAWVQSAILYIEPLDALLGAERSAEYRRLLDALAEHHGVVILSGSQSAVLRGHGMQGVLKVPFSIPTYDERRRYWQDRLDALGIVIDPIDLAQLAGRFRLAPDQIADAVALAYNRSLWVAAAEEAHPPDDRAVQPSLADLFDAARAQSGDELAGLARKIEPIHDWKDIILPDDALAQLHEMCQQIVHRHRVFDEWGFARRLSLGKGVNALFVGPSGTGKTTAAEIIAHALSLDLYKIDLSGVVSKYIGETEKNLERIFSVAENANAILFFDEADALFGKRSEVRDSHDRYANIEIAYLLQQMEQYEGVAILATNLRQNMDEAFVRRLQFVVEFPFPDEKQREEIWHILFPIEAPREENIDITFLAKQFRITGGSIKNIVLGAAFLAAGEGKPIGMRHLLQATRREYQKTGKLLSAADMGKYADEVSR
jgi:AAA+ superfamily predicted ATPase